MEFVEIIVQGIGPFPKPYKLVFGPGYNLILGGNETGKTLIYQLVTAVIDPDRFSAIKAGIPIGEGGEIAPRAGIRFRSQDREYRVIRDFKTGDLLINQLARETQEWKVVDRNPETWRKLWKKESGVTTSDYLQFFALDRFEPARVPDPGTVPAPQKKPAFAAASAPAPKNQAEKEQKIKSLKEDLARAEEIEGIEFELDGLHTQLFQIEEKSKGIPALEGKIQEAAEKLKKYAGCEELPADLEAKVTAFKKLNTQKSEELGKLEEDRKQVEAELATYSQKGNFYREPIFIAGAAAAFIALVVSLAFPNLPRLITAPFLFGGAGASLYSLWKFWSNKEKATKLKEQMAGWNEKTRVIEKRFEIEGSVIRQLLEKTGAIIPEEILARQKEYRTALAEKKRSEQEKADYLARVNLNEAEAQKVQLKAEIDKRQNRLLEMGGVAMDPMEMRREIKRLESPLGTDGPEGGVEQVEDLGGFADDPGSAPDPGEASPSGGTGPWEKIRVILNVADENELRKKVVESSSQALGTVTQGRYQMALDPSSPSGFKIIPASGQPPARGLSSSTREAAAASWQLTVWKALCSRFSLPIILDDPFRNFDPARLAFWAQNLKKISARVQIIHFSFNPGLAKIADQTVQLGK
ncbi:MAG: AAA family ATPase [bacterium]|nr:AAA family ATPase [bacterium]